MNLGALLLGSATIAAVLALAVYMVTGHEASGEIVGVGAWIVMFFGALIFGIPAFTGLNVGIAFAVIMTIILGSYLGSTVRKA